MNKYDTVELGKRMYQFCSENQIQTEEEFLGKLEKVRSEMNG